MLELELILALMAAYTDGFGAEGTGLCYHHRLNGPQGIEALASPEEIAAGTVRGREMRWGYGSGVQDAALENGQLLYALCDAYDATGEERLADAAREIWRGVKLIGSVSPYPGFVPRGPHPDGISYYRNSSRDQHAQYVYALWRWHESPLSTEEDRAFIAQFLDAFAQRMERNNWHVMVEDESEIAHVGFSWVQHAAPGAMSLLGTLRAVADITGDQRWEELWRRYSQERDGIRWDVLSPERAAETGALTLYYNQYGTDLASLARMLEGTEQGALARDFLAALAALAREAIERDVFDPDDWRRLDWAGDWDDATTQAVLDEFGLSLTEPTTALELFERFKPEQIRAEQWRVRAVAGKLLFGIPTVACHLALLSEDPELVARCAPVVQAMVATMLAHGGDYESGENFNRSVVLGLHLAALQAEGADR